MEDLKDKLLKVAQRKKFKIDLDNPKTINDKINWIKIHPTDLKTKCADKVKIHEYVKDTLGEDMCVPLIKTYNNANEINFNVLPSSYVIKCNHGCGYNIIVENKNNINTLNVRNKLNAWMKVDFAYVAGYEMQYHKIPHKILVEKYIGKAADYKFWCFNGKPMFWTYSLPNNGGFAANINYYDMDGKLTTINNMSHPRNPSLKCEIPGNFNKMVDIATKLSAPFDFVRVDLYSIKDKIYVGELTFTPGAGWIRFNDNDNLKIGNMLKLNTEI